MKKMKKAQQQKGSTASTPPLSSDGSPLGVRRKEAKARFRRQNSKVGLGEGVEECVRIIRYRDTGSPEQEICPGRWFDENLVQGIESFRGQFGFFRFGAIQKYCRVLRQLVTSGKVFNLVIGSNATDPLKVQDAQELVALLAGSNAAHLTLVALSNALFHPKVAHIVRRDGTSTAIVGSPNMTEQALGVHVEAWVEVESGMPVSEKALADIANAIDRWHTATEKGVYQLCTQADVRNLLSEGIIIETASRKKGWAASAGGTTKIVGRGSRQPRWRAPTMDAETAPEVEAETPFVTQGQEVGGVVLRWTKKLSRSDVNKNAQNIRNLMSLTKAKLIDDLDFFRKVFFSGVKWKQTTISGHASEIAKVRFTVKIPKKKTRRVKLEVVHAPHRESWQHNYHTSIRWGKVGSVLKKAQGQGYAGYWAVLEKNPAGEYTLTITPKKPKPPLVI